MSAESYWLNSFTGHLFLVLAKIDSNWDGMPQRKELKQGDVVGLLLDLGQRTLSLYLNGARRGVMVAPGMKITDVTAVLQFFGSGQAVASLAGPLRWAVEVGRCASVRIERKPPPSPAVE